MEDRIFDADAKDIVDTAFDSKLFKDDLTRDTFNDFQELIAFMLKSRFEGYKRMATLLDKVDVLRMERAKSND